MYVNLQTDNIYRKKYYKDNSCYLCLQSKKFENLKAELKTMLLKKSNHFSK
jgi:hypothetical protein